MNMKQKVLLTTMERQQKNDERSTGENSGETPSGSLGLRLEDRISAEEPGQFEKRVQMA